MAVHPMRIIESLRRWHPLHVARRERILLGAAAAVIVGTALLFSAVTWLLWNESIRSEEQRLAELAETIGTRTNEMIVAARDMLVRLDESRLPRCSEAHLEAMHGYAVDQPHIRAIGYWRATERICGIGFIQAVDLRPPAADRIYDTGVIAWWPGPQTRVAGTELFLMRFGNHDVAMDPRRWIEAGPVGAREVGLWVEGLRMAARPEGAELPSPDAIGRGLTVDDAADRIVARFTLDTVFPIDIVAVESLASFWERHSGLVATVGAIASLIVLIWIYAAFRYSQQRLSLTAELRDALASGELVARYQPIVELATGRCVGAEALARWTRSNGEVVTPDTFVPLAEQAGLVPKITLAVLDSALRELGSLLRGDPDLRIGINLAPEDLEAEGFSQALAQRIEAHGITPANIKLEITERALINSDAARGRISSLRKCGHQVAIDDFGTGYSSLAYLESFELDTLKIDKSFVQAIDTEAVTSNVASHVIDMASSLELSMIAEGVETQEQAAWLLARGVPYAQGFLYSKALSAKAFRSFLASNAVEDSNVYALRQLSS